MHSQQQSNKQPKTEMQGAGNNNRKGGGAAEQGRSEANDNASSSMRNIGKKPQAQVDDSQGNKKKSSAQVLKGKKGGPGDAPINYADDSNQGEDNGGGQASSVAGGRSQSELAMGPGLSDYTYYKILEQGRRITRHTIRNEQEPATGSVAVASQPGSKQDRQKQDDQAKLMMQQKEKDVKKMQKKPQPQKSSASQGQRPPQSSGQMQKDDGNGKTKAQHGIGKNPASQSVASRGRIPEGAAGNPKDEASNGGDAQAGRPIGDSPGSSGESKQAGQRAAQQSKRSTTRKLFERPEIRDPIGMKTHSMQLQGSGQPVAMINRAQRPSPPKMVKHQSLINPGTAAKGPQQQEKQPGGAGQSQRSLARQSVANSNWKHNTEIVAGQDANTPIDSADFKNIDQQRDANTAAKQGALNKRDEKAQQKVAKKPANQGQPSVKNEPPPDATPSNRHLEAQDAAATKEAAKGQDAKMKEQAQAGNNSKASQLTKRQGPSLAEDVQPTTKRGPPPSSPKHQDKLNQANQGAGQGRSAPQASNKGGDSSPDVRDRLGSKTTSAQISNKKGNASSQKKVGGQKDAAAQQEGGSAKTGANPPGMQTKIKQGGKDQVLGAPGQKSGGAASPKGELPIAGSGKQIPANQLPEGSRNPKRPPAAESSITQAGRARPQKFTEQDEQMLFNDAPLPPEAGNHTKKEKLPSGEKAAKIERTTSPKGQAAKRAAEAGNPSAQSGKMQHLEPGVQRDKNPSRPTSPNKGPQGQKPSVIDNDASRDRDAEMSVLQLDFKVQAPQPLANPQQRRADKKKHSMEKYVLDRHLEMKDKFEQHFPHYQYVDNRLVLYGEGSAQIESVNVPLSSRSSSNRQGPQGTVGGPTDYEKMVAHVKIYADHPSIPMKLKVLKYLGRVYTCDVKFLCPASPADDDELPGEIVENLVDDYQSREGSNHVLVVQVIDDSNRYNIGKPKGGNSQGIQSGHQSPGSSEGVKSSSQEAGQKYSTHHPMRFYFIGKDEFDDRLIMQPVTFKDLLSEKEAAELMILSERERELEGQAGQLAEQSKQRVAELAAKFDYLRDLQLFEDDAVHAQRSGDNANSEPIQWAYKPEIAQFVKAEALTVVRKFNEYKDKMSRVVVTEQNMYNSLFTLCLFDNNENQRSKGVLMQVKYDGYKKNHMLQFRHIQMKQDQKEKFEWVPLTTAQLSDHCKNQIHLLQPAPRSGDAGQAPEKYYHVTSEYFRGFVSLDYLKSLDNTYETGTRLRSKLLQLISHEASLLQVQKQLNVAVFPGKEQVHAQERDNETKYAMAQLQEESKMWPLAILGQQGKMTGRTEDSTLQLFSRREPPVKQSQLHQQTNSNLICKKCNYQREGVGLLHCAECHDAWHVQCLEEEHQQHLGVSEKQWRCPACIRCTNCKSMVGNKKLMLVCRTCNSPYHYDCLDQSVKLSVPQIVNDNNQKWRKELRQKPGQSTQKQQSEMKELIKFDYQCQNCIQCVGCAAIEAGPSRQSKWSRDFNFCSPCNRKRRAQQFCKICLENWPPSDPSLQPSQEDLLNANMIKCFTCNLWIHSRCDLILLNDSVQKQLIQSQKQSSFSKAYEARLQYCCPDCRAQKRMEYVKNIVKEIQDEDKNGFFTHEFWEEYDPPTKQSYLRQIKNPMCFEMIFKRLEELYYVYDALQLRNDLQQMFWNAKDYNRPHQLVYKDAIRLHDLCLSKISSYYPYLQRQTFAQDKEDLYRKLIHLSPDFQRRFLRILYPTLAQRQDLENERDRLLAFRERELPRFVVGEADDENQLLQDDMQAADADNDDVQLPFQSCFIEEEHIPKGLGNVSSAGPREYGPPHADRDPTFAAINQMGQHQSAPPKQGLGTTQGTLRKASIKEQFSEPLSAQAPGQSPGVNVASLGGPQPQQEDKRMRTRPGNRVRYDENNNSAPGLVFPPAKSQSVVVGAKLNAQDGKVGVTDPSAPSEPLLSGRGPNTNQEGRASPALASGGLLQKRSAQGETDDSPEQERGGPKRLKTEDPQQRFEEGIAKIIEQQQQAAWNERRETRQQSARGGADTVSNKATSRGGTKNDRLEGYSASGANSIFNPNNYPNKEKSRKLMMERYQKEDDEGCYYCNPIHCSFDDPLLIFEEMCYLCGSFGNQEDFVTCILCSESFHTYCLQLPSSDISGMYQSNWKCLNCKSCERCGKATDEDLLMFCGVCDRPYHSFCLKPAIKHLPQAWRCEHCFKCKQCGTREYYNEEDVRNGINLTNDDYQLSKNFTLCHQCGQNEYKKQSCSICLEKTTPEMNRKGETMKCRDCGFYSHIACSRVSYEELYMLLLEFNEQNNDQATQLKSVESVYKCLDCMMKGKSVNFLILESCLHYENIHSLIMRQQFISDICIEILCNYFPEQFRMKAPKFIQKFITQNQEFFRSDDVIVKWVELMEREVNFEGVAVRAQDGGGQGKEEEREEEKEIQLPRGHWKKYNPFEPSKFMPSDGKSKNLLKDLEAQPLMAPTNSVLQAKHAQALTSLCHKYDYQKLICGVKSDKVTPAMKIENSMTCFKRSMLPEKRSMYESLYKQTLNRYSLSGPGGAAGGNQTHLPSMSLETDVLALEQQESVAQSQGIQGQQCRKMYVDQEEMQRILCPTQEKRDKLIDRLVNGIEDDEELSSEYDSESCSVDYEFREGFGQGQNDKRKLEESKEDRDPEGREIAAVAHESKSRSLVELYVQYELKAVMRIKLQFFKWFEEFFAKTMNVFLGQSSGQNQQPQSERQAQITQNQIQDDTSNDSYKDFDCSESRSVDSMVLCPEDCLIDNPQKLLTCLLCKLKGEYTVTGRLIPYKLNMYVHTSCAIWTDEVFDIDDQQIINFYQQQKKLQGQKCALCNDYGATLSCSRSKGCNKHYHFPCAYRSGRVRFNRHKEAFCESCIGTRGQSTAIPISLPTQGVGANAALMGTRGAAAQGGTSGALALAEEQNTGSRNMFPYEFLKKRRLYIVQNTKEINQQEYENEMENQMLNDEKEKKNSRGEKDSHKGGKGDKGKKNDKNDAASNQNNNQGSQKEVDLDKWRPFYFDLFNRVGNLTVLSLRKEVNQLIDIVQKDNSASGINNIQAYIQQQQLLYAEKLQNQQSHLKQKDNESPVRKLSRPGAAGPGAYNQGGTSGTLMEDLRKYLDLFNDYATIRIYWKFYDDKRMQKPAEGNEDPRKLRRAYYLFMNKSKKIIELEKNDLRTVMEYCAQQIGSNFIVQSHVNNYLRDSSQIAIPNRPYGFEFIDQDVFWAKIIDHFRAQRANFSLQNIEFCVEKLFGLAKYPINVWNQLELTNHDLKYNLNTQKSRLSFFLKSAISVFHATTANAAGYPHPYNLSGVANAPSTTAAGGQKDKSGTTLDPKTLLNGRVLSLDGVFQRMIKVNNMDKYEYDIVHSNYYKKLQQQNSGQVAPMSSRFAYRPGGTQDRDRQWAAHHGQGAGASAGLSGSSSVVHGGMGHGGSGVLAGLVSGSKSGAGMLLGSGVPIEYNINQMDQLSVNNLSSKHMTMNQLLTAMGRGHKVDIGKISKILESQKTSKQNRKLQQSRGLQDQDIESLERSELRARKRVLESKQHLQHINLMSQAQQQQAELTATQLNSQNVNKVNKINLPLAMLYRSSLQLPPKVEVGPSKIHRIGLFTLEDLKPLDIVIEYVGEIIRHEVADLREKRYIEKGIGDCYMFTIDDQHIIDATFFGGKARYLNHSCDANCSAKIITVDNQKHIIIRAKKHITAGSELTYNYNFDQEEDQMSCLCGAKNCQGYLA